MTYIETLLAVIGMATIAVSIVCIINFAFQTWFDLRACKRDIERLERRINNLPCTRQ